MQAAKSEIMDCPAFCTAAACFAVCLPFISEMKPRRFGSKSVSCRSLLTCFIQGMRSSPSFIHGAVGNAWGGGLELNSGCSSGSPCRSALTATVLEEPGAPLLWVGEARSSLCSTSWGILGRGFTMLFFV